VPASVKAAEINSILQEIETLPGETLTLGGEAEEGNRLIKEMSMAMGFAVLLILLVLVLQFNSFHQSIMVLVLIPLSLTGVFIGFWVTGRTITFPTMIGIVSLAGIIVNDAIVLVDQLNQKRKNKEAEKQKEINATGEYDEFSAYNNALIHAGASRFQPIFLTSITTVFGMLPLSLSDEVWGGLGFAIIYGMLISTILCLLLLPAFLRFYKDIGRMFSAIWRGIKRVFGRGDSYQN
jgi:HAE1 family hydrophobic/amphiphilic exporter-1